MDLSLDEIIKANKVSQARSEAVSSVSSQKRDSSLNYIPNRGMTRGKALNFIRRGPNEMIRSGDAIRGRALNWPGNSYQGQNIQVRPAFRVQGRGGFINPRFTNRRGFVSSYRRGGGFVNRSMFQNFSQRGLGFVNRGGFGSRNSNYSQSYHNNASHTGSIALTERLVVVPPHMRRFNRGNARNYYQNRIPVHQRLGWITPAQRIAHQRLFVARQILDRRPNQFQYNQSRPTYRYNYSTYQQRPYMNQLVYNRQQKAAQYRQKRRKANAVRNNGRASPTGFDFSIVIQNELAERPQYVGRGRGRGQNKFVAQLTRHNVAQLPGGDYSEAPGSSNQSVSFRSEDKYKKHNRNLCLNRAYRAQRQLCDKSPTATSLSALRRKLQPAAMDADGFACPLVPIQPHVVQLDKEVQGAIRAMQEELAERTPNRAQAVTGLNCQFCLGSQPTATTINDRFAMLASLSNCDAAD